jgi:hypothetical protein
MYENLWAYTPTSGHTPDLTGYRVEATDGHIGKVDKHSDEVGSQYIVVDTGIWIFGKEVLLPAGTITTITHEDKNLGDPHYRDQLGGHYGSGH